MTHSPWFPAIRFGDLATVRAALADGAPVDVRDAAGRTALHLAAGAGRLDLVRLLLDAGADVEARVESADEDDGFSGPTIRVLGPGAGLDIEARIAEATEHADPEARSVMGAIGKLLSAFADDADGPEGGEGETREPAAIGDADDDQEFRFEVDDPAEVATPLLRAVAGGHPGVVGVLLAAGAEVEARNWDAGSPLVVAARVGVPEITRQLLEAGAAADRGFDELPLHVAAARGDLATVDLLLEGGANVDRAEEDGLTALMAAAWTGHLPVVERLLRAGADPNRVGDGTTALGNAARQGHEAIVALLEPLVDDEIREWARHERHEGVKDRAKAALSEPASQELVDAAMFGKLGDVRRELAGKAPVDGIGENGLTALMYAASYGHLEVIDALIEAGADPDVGALEDIERGRTALMMAAGSFFAPDRLAVMERLLAAGADLEARDEEGRTALHVAITSGSGYTRSVEALLRHGADPNPRDVHGATPLMLAKNQNAGPIVAALRAAGASEDGLADLDLLRAAEAGDLDAVERALAAGADVEFRLDWTPLGVAAMNGHLEVVRRLLDAGADVDRAESDPPEDPDEPWRGDFTPLIRAAYGPHPDVVRCLIEAGADLHAKNHGRTALDYARLGKVENPKRGPWEETAAILERALTEGEAGG